MACSSLFDRPTTPITSLTSLPSLIMNAVQLLSNSAFSSAILAFVPSSSRPNIDVTRSEFPGLVPPSGDRARRSAADAVVNAAFPAPSTAATCLQGFQ